MSLCIQIIFNVHLSNNTLWKNFQQQKELISVYEYNSVWFFTHKNCRGQKANWGDWKAVWNWLVTKRKTSNWQKLRNWQALWKWQHIVKQRNTVGPADVSHWCKLGDYHCVVDRFYIALFSALEQTHCAHTILNEWLWWTHDKEHLKRRLQILKLSKQKKLKTTLEFTHKTILIHFEKEKDEAWSTLMQHNQPRWQHSRVPPLSEAAAKLESNPFPSVVQSFGKGLSWQHVGKNPSLASWTDDVVVASKIGKYWHLGKNKGMQRVKIGDDYAEPV